MPDQPEDLLSDALPFYLALEPSPRGDQIAFAVVRLDPVSRDFAVSVVVEDRSVAMEVFRFSRLKPVCIAWSPSGRDLAFAQGTTLLLRNDTGALRPLALPAEIQSVGFDAEARLWHLAGDTLSTGETSAISGIDAVASGSRIAFARREPGATTLHRIEAGEPSLLARVPGDHATIKLTSCGDHLVAVLADAARRRQVAATVLRIHVPSGRVETLLDRTLPCGFNAGPGLDAAVSEDGDVYAAFEDGECTRLWQLTPDTTPIPMSPPGFEVSDFNLQPGGRAVAVIASDTSRAHGVFESVLLVGRRTGIRWEFEPAVQGVHDMPRWRANGSLEILCGTTGRWQRVTGGNDAPPPLPSPRRVQSLDGLELLRLPGPEHRNVAVLLLPRLHQRYGAGAQTLFFHHMIVAVARGLAADGYTVITVSGPGAIGGGRRRREFAGGYLPALTTAMHQAVETLEQAGCDACVLLGGSMAAVPGLRLLGAGSPFAAACFIAPLMEASIPVTAPVQDLLLDDPSFPDLNEAAAALRVPTCIIYAETDDVAPASQVDLLRRRVKNPGLLTCHVLPNERHIFDRMSSWRQAQAFLSAFLAASTRR